MACRKRGTFVLRITTALIGLVLGGFCLLLSSLGNVPMTGIGKALFGILTWVSFIAAAGAGLFVTSDCVSEEKREGTLGLLFLTDLRGYDVVAGHIPPVGNIYNPGDTIQRLVQYPYGNIITATPFNMYFGLDFKL